MKIKIENLTFDCIIGLLDFERKIKQEVIINVSFKYKYKTGVFIDYSEIVTFIENTMKSKKFELIEEALLYLNKQIITKYPVKKLKIQITKPNIIKNCFVSVSL